MTVKIHGFASGFCPRPCYIYENPGDIIQAVEKSHAPARIIKKNILRYQLQYLINNVYHDINQEEVRSAFSSILLSIDSIKTRLSRRKNAVLLSFNEFTRDFGTSFEILTDNKLLVLRVEDSEIKTALNVMELIFEAGIPDSNFYMLQGTSRKSAVIIIKKLNGGL